MNLERARTTQPYLQGLAARRAGFGEDANPYRCRAGYAYSRNAWALGWQEGAEKRPGTVRRVEPMSNEHQPHPPYIFVDTETGEPMPEPEPLTDEERAQRFEKWKKIRDSINRRIWEQTADPLPKN